MTRRTRADYRGHARARTPRADAANPNLATNPLTLFTWHSVFWANDPSWTPPADGAGVSSWPNRGTDTTAVVQATSGFQPLYRQNHAVMGGRATLDFDGVDDRLQSSAPFTDVNNPHTYAVIAAPKAGTGTRVILASRNNAAWRILAVSSLQQFFIRTGGAGSAQIGGTNNNAAHLFIVYAIVGNDQLTVDGTTVISGAEAGDGTAQLFNLGWDSTGVFFPGYISFVGFYAGDLQSHANFATFKAWASAYYQLQIA